MPKHPNAAPVQQPTLSLPQAITQLGTLREKIMAAVATGRISDHDQETLLYESEILLEDALGKGTDDVARILEAGVHHIIDEDSDLEAMAADHWKLRAGLVEKLIERLQRRAESSSQVTPSPVEQSPLEVVDALVRGFHRVARRLRVRHDKRATLDVKDEYDVQDPLIVDTPLRRYSARSDQLIIDIARYRRHTNCKALVCFVYDPLGRIGNPTGLERDLSGIHDGFPVRVLVAPQS